MFKIIKIFFWSSQVHPAFVQSAKHKYCVKNRDLLFYTFIIKLCLEYFVCITHLKTNLNVLKSKTMESSNKMEIQKTWHDDDFPAKSQNIKIVK